MIGYKTVFLLLIICSLIIGPVSGAAQKDNSHFQIFKNKRQNVSSNVQYVPDEIIVKFKPGVSKEKIASVNSKHGASVLYTSPYAGFKRLHIPKSKTVEEMVEIYSKNPNVEYAVPNSIVHAFMIPSDPLYSYQWHLDDSSTSNPYGGENGGGINVEPAWDISDGTGVIVAVLDTGVAYEDYGRYKKAPDLANTNFVPGWDFVNNDAHPNDDNSHGTHVAGTIAQSTNNGIGVAGVAFGSSIMPVKVLDKQGSGTLQQLVDGIYFAADNDADVISMSLGWPAGYDPGQPLKDALDYAYNKGVTIVCAAGNDGASQISYPAAYDKCIAVGATRYDETRASYSNYGSGLDIMAPGGDTSVDQNNDGYGDGILQNTFNPTTKNPSDFGYWFFQGTSMATPHVSGVAALLIANGVTGPDTVRDVLLSTAEDKGPKGWDAEYGWGIVDAYAALQYSATPNEPPAADPSGPYSGYEGSPVIFNGSGSTDSDGSIVSYSWDFGDGNTGTGVSPSHTYTDNGIYTVTLTVTDNRGDTNTSTTTAVINNVAPSASASGPYSGYVNVSITFSGSASDPGASDVLTYEWDFNYNGTFDIDASGINLTDPSHTYTQSGNYTVALRVTDDDGGVSNISTAVVSISEAPANTIHVQNIEMSLETRRAGRNTFTHATAVVTIVDAGDNPVSGATVSGHWSNATSDSDSEVTDSHGLVSLYSDEVKNAPPGTTFTFTVDNVELDGWTYNPSANIETTDSIST